MTERIRYATSHIHELGAEIQRRVLDGYILDTSSAFCIKRQGSAYVAHFLPTRESLDFDSIELPVIEMTEDQSKKISERGKEARRLTIHEKWEIDDEINFEADEQKKLAESEDCGTVLFTKESLDELYWTDLQEVGRKFGVKQRDRKKLTRMILEAQEKDGGN